MLMLMLMSMLLASEKIAGREENDQGVRLQHTTAVAL